MDCLSQRVFSWPETPWSSKSKSHSAAELMIGPKCGLGADSNVTGDQTKQSKTEQWAISGKSEIRIKE